MVLAVRLTRCTPRERSSSATCRDTRDPEIPSERAAWLKLRDFVTPTKLRMIVSWSISLLAAEDAPATPTCPVAGPSKCATLAFANCADSALTWIQTNVTDLAGCYRRTPIWLHLGTWQPQLRLYPHSGGHRCDQGLEDAGRRGGRDMGAGAPPAHGRSRARGHLRRIRDARRRYHLAGDRPPPGRSPSLWVGVQRFSAGKRDWHRAGRDAGRPCAARADDARRSCPVRPRPGCRRDRAGHAGSRGGPGGAGPWRRGRARSGIRGYLPVLSRGVPAAHVRRPFHRVGGARPDRAGRRRPGGRCSWLAMGIPGLDTAGDR